MFFTFMRQKPGLFVFVNAGREPVQKGVKCPKRILMLLDFYFIARLNNISRR